VQINEGKRCTTYDKPKVSKAIRDKAVLKHTPTDAREIPSLLIYYETSWNGVRIENFKVL
jgi:hypothetical protein